MKVELIDLESQYPVFESWWKGHGWDAVPKAILPKLGVVAVDVSPVAAGWLYMDNSVGVCMLEWLVTDPSASPRQTAKALHVVTDFLRQEAIRLNYSVMLATCRQKSLSKFLQKRDFQVTDSDVIHHIKVL